MLQTRVLTSKKGRPVRIEVDDQTLLKIVNDVRSDSSAMDALHKGYLNSLVARRRGDLSSPQPPTEYHVIYRIMNQYDARYAGTISNKIIKHLETELIESEP